MPDTHGGVVLQVDPVAPDAQVPRGHPCQAECNGQVCGATPAGLYRRVCQHRHTRDVRVCATHHGVIRADAFGGTCHQCANDSTHPHLCPIELIELKAAAR